MKVGSICYSFDNKSGKIEILKIYQDELDGQIVASCKCLTYHTHGYKAGYEGVWLLKYLKEIKTSEEWYKGCEVTILDPDGWDRRNFQFSWHEEMITKEEFDKRVLSSTVRMNLDFLDKNK